MIEPLLKGIQYDQEVRDKINEIIAELNGISWTFLMASEILGEKKAKKTQSVPPGFNDIIGLYKEGKK